MNHLVLPTLSEILIDEGIAGDRVASGRLRAQQQWYGAIRGLNQLLERADPLRTPETPSQTDSRTATDIPPPETRGYVISGPSPVLMTSALAAHFTTQILTCESQFGTVGSAWGRERGFRLLPASDGEDGSVSVETIPEPLRPSAFPLSENDPLTREPFCLVLTARFSLVMVLGVDETDNPAFLFSFDPETVGRALGVLRDRMVARSSTSPRHLHHQIAQLDAIAAQFPPVEPHYRTVTEFGRLLLQNLPPEGDRREPKPKSPATETVATSPAEGLFDTDGHFVAAADRTIHKSQVELLQAIAHEVRTPLTTIRTFTRLLLKRKTFDPEVARQRLEAIDRECTIQIDRFNLIFRAVELEMSQVRERSCQVHTSPGVQLTTMSLGDVFQSGLPRWQKQAGQRNHTLEVILPKQLPAVVSDPTLLDQMLTGAIENFTRSLPSGSHIHVGVRLAGQLLKLQLESHSQTEAGSPFCGAPKSPLKSIGPLLMVQPETGSLSLNMNVTKNLFQALGGKLVMRQRPQQGKVMTIFLPVQVSSVEGK
ncbi:HAMP domain-containing sensor histidine kinase [Lyngbya sp. CCY1209]|uniref:sensor histidine kinase n=1 Tax=Lyngbya sp. CCY1209 TaxID=2886103 RepID=UPI002D204E01|nr:HAMP domain-containing sensor histidine kinase [Lyngbya sp. CCY1209]MEB3882010.1 HAMP domain-containing histidine kinase [Lyngbya sp. CCY1209]